MDNEFPSLGQVVHVLRQWLGEVTGIGGGDLAMLAFVVCLSHPGHGMSLTAIPTQGCEAKSYGCPQ